MEKFEIIRKLLEQDRSYRRFDHSVPVSRETLLSLAELTRYCASGRNLQPLKYRIVDTAEETGAVFPLLKWAGYLTDWDGPVENERPTAYLVQCLDTSLTNDCMCDDGLQIQAITLGATAMGLGACVIKSFNAVRLPEVLGIPDHLKPLYVIALGVPLEKVIIEDMKDGDIKYYRDYDRTHHVPKRSLDELIIKTPFHKNFMKWSLNKKQS